MDDHDLILAEEFLLLALDDEKGPFQLWNGADPALAGALLLDLAAAGAVHVTDGKLAAAPDARLEHPLLKDAHGAIAASDKPRDAHGPAAPRPTCAIADQGIAGKAVSDAVQAEVMTTILTTTVSAGAATAASGN